MDATTPTMETGAEIATTIAPATPSSIEATSTDEPMASPASSATDEVLTRTQTSSPTAAATAQPVAYTESQARLLLPLTMIHAGDLSGAWTTREQEQTNADLTASDKQSGQSAERCGRLLGRTSLLQPEDVPGAYRAGEILAVSSSVGVYASAAGAAECFHVALDRFHLHGELARSFGSVFPDPASVTVQFIDTPRLGDESFAATAAGNTKYFAFNIPLAIYMVEFRFANVLAIVTLTRHSVPAAEDIAPLAQLVLDRIVANR